jgi:MFS family permease
MTLALARSRTTELTGAAAVAAVAAMIGVLFAGSTLVTPLYVIYQEQWGFSRITLTLIYAAYVVGNLAALLVFGRLSDHIGRRRTAVPVMAVAIVSALVFLLAHGVAWLYAGRIVSGLAVGVGTATATAWLAELIAEKGNARATRIATITNFLGLGIAALIAGLLAQYVPWPLRLPFVLYLATLLATLLAIARTRETMSRLAKGLRDVPLRPRIAVPRAIRVQFVAPAVTAFGAMALVGFYAALAPSILAENLHETSHAVAGALFFELACVVAGSIALTQRLSSRAAMLTALVLMPPSVVLIAMAQVLGTMVIMIAATAICAVAAGLGYRGSLQIVNEIAPADRRAEVVASYLICVFCGNALPVIGIGVISTLTSPITASLTFSAMIIVCALAALAFGIKGRPA